ncbi:POL, partial [Enterospora canceri]
MVGKPNQTPPVAPLHPIPAVNPPFTRVRFDMVGPLPTTKAGHKYLLTIMDVTTRYPEAIPVRSTHARVVLKALLNFFTHFGLPPEIQSDRGTNFTSKLFNKTMTEWGIKHFLSSAYHPQSQGALERHHQTLKTMLRAFCLEREKDWDEAVPYVLFAVREAPTESLGFSPNQLVFGHRVRGPLDLVREAWCAPHSDRPESLLKSVLRTRERLVKALEVAQQHLGAAPKKKRRYYDPKVKYYDFAPGEETTEVSGSELVVPAEHWGQCGVLLRERLQYLEGVQKKKFHCQSEGVITGVKPRDKRESSVYSVWSSNRDQIEEPLNVPPTKHFDTSAEIPEQAPEAGVNAAEAE